MDAENQPCDIYFATFEYFFIFYTNVALIHKCNTLCNNFYSNSNYCGVSGELIEMFRFKTLRLSVRADPSSRPVPWLWRATYRNKHSLSRKGKAVSWRLELSQLYLPIKSEERLFAL